MIDLILAFLSRLPWGKIAIALAAVVLLFLAYSWAESRGYHSRDDEVAALARDRDTYKANFANLDAALKQQNEALLAENAASIQKQKDGAEALAAVKRENEALASQATALRKSGAVKRGDDAPCQISGTLAGVRL